MMLSWIGTVHMYVDEVQCTKPCILLLLIGTVYKPCILLLLIGTVYKTVYIIVIDGYSVQSRVYYCH